MPGIHEDTNTPNPPSHPSGPRRRPRCRPRRFTLVVCVRGASRPPPRLPRASCTVRVVRAFLFCFEERLFSSHLPLCTVALPLCDLNRDRICACACAFCIFLSGSELPPAVSSSRAGAMWRADGELRVAMLLLLIVTCVPPAGSFGGLTYLRKPAASEAGPELEFHQEAMSRTADSVYKMPVRSRHGPRTQRRTRAIRACAHARCPYHPSSHPPRCRTAIHTACKRTSTGGGAARRVRHSRRRFQ